MLRSRTKKKKNNKSLKFLTKFYTYSGSNEIVTQFGRPARPRPFCRPGSAGQRRRPSQSAKSAKVFGHVGHFIFHYKFYRAELRWQMNISNISYITKFLTYSSDNFKEKLGNEEKCIFYQKLFNIEFFKMLYV
ncbi:hypothetical protein BpHYR1_003274 [Brachionus plicatilis]|uniref:Uncharacterized protein n=1 Tax=Brachionus plicatilis TaxID=10195 RepID=A0A3M7RA35_BRAPC|nr:hypothetical protein BpHYR1_003274 [Brachionus plicatilis]